ncbi:MAG: restriction endonuclease subunit S [Mollicutes bacterium]|nr:restriction endonuclease subunit S [Mollicutes bacterium]
MKVKLRDVSNIIMGQSPDSSTYNTEKIGLPFFQGNADFGELNPIAKTWCSAPIKIAYKNYILISVRAPIGALNIAAETCCIGRGLAAFDVNNKMCTQKYLWYLLKAKKNELLSKGTGSTFKAISKNILSEMEFNIPPVREQELCTKVLDVVFCLIRLKKEQLDKLDLLVKSRFIEMFGDPLNNSQSLNSMPMTDVCYIIDGDRGKNYPTANDFYEDEHCLFLNAKNVTSNGFSFDSCMFITKEKDQSLRKGKLKRGDVVLTTRGTLGNLAYYTDDVPYENIRINSGMVILRMHKSTVNEVFFIEQFKMLLDDIKAKIASGSAQPQLPISTMNKIVMIIPEISEQNQFADFVAQVDKSKFVVTAKFQ